MRSRLVVLFALALAVPLLAVQSGSASPSETYVGPFFGANNFPPGCEALEFTSDWGDDGAPVPDNGCYNMRTGLNALDSPQVDVLVLVPVSPTAERDMRIMRQSVEMWEGGIEYLADEMGLDWLRDGVDFHITVDYVDVTGEGDGGEFTTYPFVDPEIVVVASNPVGGIGIGIDPLNFGGQLAEIFGLDAPDGPCHGLDNPFDFEQWEALPGFDSHHESRTGTFSEDCDGKGGNICFAVNGAIDPDYNTIDFFNLFDLVSHEFGHCLTLGHVGDGAEGPWGTVPTNDIMAYHADPPGLVKCVSTLDVEVFATRMSNYLDTNADGVVDEADVLVANDPIGQGGNPFHVQHPAFHSYASSTGDVMDCPQPDLGLEPGTARTDWTPDPVATTRPELTVTAPDDGAVSGDGTFTVTGSVARVPLEETEDPTSPVGFHDDADDDASTPVTEILDLDVAVTATDVTATIALADLWPSTDAASPTSYSLVVDGRKFDSFVRYPVDSNPLTWDNGAGAYTPGGFSAWDLDAKTVTFTIPRSYLADAGLESPYFLSSSANIGALSSSVADDLSPESGETIGVAAGSYATVSLAAPIVTASDTVVFEHPSGNTFHPEESTLGATQDLGADPSHHFALELLEVSDVTFTMTWTDAVGGADLDLYVGGAADGGTQGATAGQPEVVVLSDVQGTLDIQVDPYLVTDPVDGSTYTLTAEVATDGGTGGETDPPTEIVTGQVEVYADDVLVGSQDVDTAVAADTFAIPVTLPAGAHTLRVDWVEDGEVLASESRAVTVQFAATGPDRDEDGVADDADNCPTRANADQSDIDGDGAGDACDPDIDGDGHSNGKEAAHGTNPNDPADHPSPRN